MSFIKTFAVLLLSFTACQVSAAQDSFWTQYDGLLDYEVKVARSPGYQILAKFNNPISNPITGTPFHHKLFDSVQELDDYKAANPQFELIEHTRFSASDRKQIVIAVAPTWSAAQDLKRWIKERNRLTIGTVDVQITPIVGTIYQVGRGPIFQR